MKGFKKCSHGSWDCLVIFIIINLTTISHQAVYNPGVCETETCKATASKIREFMDPDTNPCDDFYGFVCGNFSKNAELKGSQIDIFTHMQKEVLHQLKDGIEQISDRDPKALKKLKSFYDICINENLMERDGKNVLKELFKKLGGWPVLEDSWDDSNFDWTNLVAESSKRGILYESFISISISPSLKNNSKNYITIGQPKFGLPVEILINDSATFYHYQYLSLMMMVVEILGTGFDKSFVDLNYVLYLEKSLAKIALNTTEKAKLDNAPIDLMTIAEMQREFPYINWLDHINNLLAPYKTVDSNYIVNVEGRIYLKELGSVLKRYSKRILANYVFWRMAHALSNAWNGEVYRFQVQLQNSLTPRLSALVSSKRWETCVSYANNMAPLLTGALYVRKYFDHSKKESVLTIIDDIFDSFKRVLEQVDWMDPETKMEAKKKLNNMVTLIAYPDELLDDAKLDDYFEDLKIDPQSILLTELNTNVFFLKKVIESLDRPVDKGDWTGIYGAAAAVVNAFHIPTRNVIQFPAAILQHPFYIPDNLDYMNYAALGYVIGHEITHGFDNTGRKYDKDGNLRNWWDPLTEAKFNKNVDCIIDQYNSYTYHELNQTLNGDISQGENIADNGGVKMAYLAYNKRVFENFKKTRRQFQEPQLPGFENYSSRQMFWIAYAHVSCIKYKLEKVGMEILLDEHVPNEYRIIGTVSNNRDFAKDFECDEGTPMNPRNKCQVW